MGSVKDTIKILRRNFDFTELSEEGASRNPISQFERWMEDAVKAGIHEPNAMTLATVDKKGFPNARIVLLRDFDNKGFSFFTNYKSMKATELIEKKACLNFFWLELSRQVKIRGTVKKLSAKQSDDYFKTRPRESQIGAWASAQSEVIAGRQHLEKEFQKYEKKFQGKDVPRPAHWGGYLVVPVSIEFWQGRPNRLHERLLYTKQKTGWKMVRLAP